MKTLPPLLPLSALLLTTALSSGSTLAQGKAPVVLTVWTIQQVVDDMNNDPNGKGKYGLTLKQIFEKEHPGVTVNMVYRGWDDELRQNLSNALLSGTAPDVIVGEGYVKTFASLGALLPIPVGDLQKNLIPGTVQGAVYKGKVYGLPGLTGVFGFERNCQVVKAAGLDCTTAPKTWDDLLKEAKTITDKGAGKTFGATIQGPGQYAIGAAFRNYVYLLQAGTDFADTGPSGLDVPAFNDPKAVKVYEFLRQLNKYTPPGLTFEADEGKLYSQLFAGVTGYQMAGSWHIDWAKSNKCADCRYSDVPLPAGGKPASVIVGNVLYSALKVSKRPSLALAFVKLTQRDAIQNLVYSTVGRLPATRSSLRALRPKVDAANQAFVDVLLNSANLKAMPQWEKNPQKVWQAYTDFLNKLYTTDTSVATLLDSLQKDALQAMK